MCWKQYCSENGKAKKLKTPLKWFYPIYHQSRGANLGEVCSSTTPSNSLLFVPFLLVFLLILFRIAMWTIAGKELISWLYACSVSLRHTLGKDVEFHCISSISFKACFPIKLQIWGKKWSMNYKMWMQKSGFWSLKTGSLLIQVKIMYCLLGGSEGGLLTQVVSKYRWSLGPGHNPQSKKKKVWLWLPLSMQKKAKLKLLTASVNLVKLCFVLLMSDHHADFEKRGK